MKIQTFRRYTSLIQSVDSLVQAPCNLITRVNDRSILTGDDDDDDDADDDYMLMMIVIHNGQLWIDCISYLNAKWDCEEIGTYETSHKDLPPKI